MKINIYKKYIKKKKILVQEHITKINLNTLIVVFLSLAGLLGYAGEGWAFLMKTFQSSANH